MYHYQWKPAIKIIIIMIIIIRIPVTIANHFAISLENQYDHVSWYFRNLFYKFPNIYTRNCIALYSKFGSLSNSISVLGWSCHGVELTFSENFHRAGVYVSTLQWYHGVE